MASAWLSGGMVRRACRSWGVIARPGAAISLKATALLVAVPATRAESLGRMMSSSASRRGPRPEAVEVDVAAGQLTMPSQR